jgi:hypothetical protein
MDSGILEQVARMHIRKRMSVRRRSTPPVEEAPKTWAQVLVFPLSVVAVTFMAAILLIYLGSVWLLVPPDEHYERYTTAPPPTYSDFDSGVSMNPPPQAAEKQPSGGIVIEK